MSHSNKTNDNHAGEQKVQQPDLKTHLLDEFPVLPEKFFKFTHERIALLWMKETNQSPIRGKRSSTK